MVKLTNFHKQNIEKMAKSLGVMIEKVDMEGYWDTSITAEENYNKFREILELLSTNGRKLEKSYAKDVVEHYEQMALEEETAFIQEQIHKGLEDIKKSTTSQLEKYYWVQDSYLDMVLKSDEINSLVLLGRAGLGKTFETIRYLASNNVDFQLITGMISPLELFHLLYENKENKLLVFDDCKAILNNPQTSAILLQALWGVPKRIVAWRTTSTKLKVPETFVFNSKIIVIVNDIPQEIEPLMSRCLLLGVEFDYNQILSIMGEICKTPHKSLTKEERFEIWDWIRQNTDETTEDFNLRLQKKIEMIYQHKKDKWKDLSKLLIKKDDTLALVKRIMTETSSVKAQVQKFSEETGKSRRQFFYLKKLVQKCSSNYI
jgi:hypothetical protein